MALILLGAWEVFNIRSGPVYVASKDFPAELLPNSPEKFVCTDLSNDVMIALNNIAQKGKYNFSQKGAYSDQWYSI